jgi:hypothetical protein
MEVQRIGPAPPGRRHRHRHRRSEAAGDPEEIAHRFLGHQRKIAGKKQHRVRTAFGGANKAPLGGDVLAFLPWLDQNFGA